MLLLLALPLQSAIIIVVEVGRDAVVVVDDELDDDDEAAAAKTAAAAETGVRGKCKPPADEDRDSERDVVAADASSR